MQAEQLISNHSPRRSEAKAGRGAPENPANRFEKIHLERDEDWNPEEDPSPKTQFLVDHSKRQSLTTTVPISGSTRA